MSKGYRIAFFLLFLHLFPAIDSGELSFQFFDIGFAQCFNFPFFLVFFPKYWNVHELDIFVSGEFHE